jgi:hypothetical protein
MGGPSRRAVIIVWVGALAAVIFALTAPMPGPDDTPVRVVSTLVRTPDGGWQYPDGTLASDDLAEVLGDVVTRGESVPVEAPGLAGAEAVPLNDGTVVIVAPVTSLPDPATTQEPTTATSASTTTVGHTLPTVVLTIDTTTTTTEVAP